MKQPRPSLWALLTALVAGILATHAYQVWQEDSAIGIILGILAIVFVAYSLLINAFSHDDFVFRINEWDNYRAKQRRAKREFNDCPNESESGI